MCVKIHFIKFSENSLKLQAVGCQKPYNCYLGNMMMSGDVYVHVPAAPDQQDMCVFSD